MRQIFDFVKTTVVGGAIFLLPFAAVLLVVIKAGKMAVNSRDATRGKAANFKGRGGSRRLSRRDFFACASGLHRWAFRAFF